MNIIIYTNSIIHLKGYLTKFNYFHIHVKTLKYHAMIYRYNWITVSMDHIQFFPSFTIITISSDPFLQILLINFSFLFPNFFHVISNLFQLFLSTFIFPFCFFYLPCCLWDSFLGTLLIPYFHFHLISFHLPLSFTLFSPPIDTFSLLTHLLCSTQNSYFLRLADEKGRWLPVRRWKM